MKDVIKCYVAGRYLPDDPKEGIVSFAVPEYGVLFRCSAQGNKADLEIIAFLTFLRFVEHNIDIFNSRILHIYTDFPLLVYLMNKDAIVPGMDAVVREAEKYAKNIKYEVKFVHERENRATGSVNDIPPMPADSKIKIKTFANLSLTKPKINLTNITPQESSGGGIKI
ncbi:MAG: hypothetical protein KAR42_01895 [candidate division Zixibacteria bacterium]|nr:hypothetical protein [candidate division Zixibacteria bacterium]